MEHYYISSTHYNIQERQTKKNGKVYDVVFYITDSKGLPRQKKLSGFKTKTLAKEGYTQFVTKYCTLYKNNVSRSKISHEKTLVSDLIDTYLNSLTNQNKDSTVYEKRHLFNKKIKPTFIDVHIEDITKEFIYKWQDNLWSSTNDKGEFYSYAYLTKIRTHTNTFFSWCEQRYDVKNYLKEIKKPNRRTPKNTMEIWTREEFEKFISVVKEPLYYTLFSTLFFTGRRKGEVFALTKDDVKKDSILFNKSVTIKTTDSSTYKVTSTKTEKIQATPICEPLKNILSKYKGDSPFFFGGKKPLAPETVRRKFKYYCSLAGVKQIRIHDLRHSFVSMLIHLGANFTVVASLIDDTLEQITKTYAHMYVADKNTVIKLIK